MKDDERQQFGTIMVGLAENFDTSLSAPGVKMRFEALKGYSIEEIEQASYSLLRTRKFTKMPTVAEIEEHIQGGSIEDQAQVESSKVLKAIGEQGRYASVVFDDPVTQAVIQFHYDGWPNICSQELKDRRFFLQEFQKAYASYKRQGTKHYGVLPGQTQIQNGSIGQSQFIPKPIRIGDPEAAEQVRLNKAEQERQAISEEAEQKEVSRIVSQVAASTQHSG